MATAGVKELNSTHLFFWLLSLYGMGTNDTHIRPSLLRFQICGLCWPVNQLICGM